MKKRGILGIAVAVAVGMAMATLLQFPVPVYAANVVEINDSTFPDAAFQSYVRGKSIDKNGDGLLSVEEQEAVTSIWVNGKNISSLQGIEYFPNLKTLVAQKNNLTSIDLSQNTKLESLTIHTNQLSELTISANTELKTLSCYNNHIPKINVTYCYKLKDAVEKGDRTTVVDGTTEYDKILGDYGTIYLDVDTDTIIEVEGIPVDEDHFPDANFRSYLLNVLDDDKNTYLSDAEIFQTEIINVSGYEITSLKGVEYFTNIYKLDASQNFLSGLDISKNVKLNYLYLNNNDITMIDLSDNTALMDVKFSNNPNLVSLDFSDTTILANIECNNCTKLASLTIGKRGELKSLSCTNSALTSIDIIGCDSLKKLLCYGNPMTKLDIRGCNLLIEAFEKATVDTTNPVGANTYNYGTVLSYPATAELIAYDSENWTVSFDGNGGTGTMNSLVVTDGDAITLPTCEFTAPEGKVFDSWNVGKPGDQITVNNNIEVKAVWKNLYAVQLSSNLSADAIETLTGEGTYVDGSSVTVSVSLKEGQRYVFRCWKNTATNTIVSTAPSYTFAITGATSLSAEFAEAEKAEGPAAPTGLGSVAASIKGAADGVINGVSIGMEYAMNESFTEAIAVNGSEITGLAAGTYYVRVAETETTKAGAYTVIVVEDGPEDLSLNVEVKHTCSVQNNLSLNYKVKIKTEGDFQNVRLVIERQVFEGTGTEYSWDKVTLTDYTIDENGRYCFYYRNLAAKEMGSIVKATVVAEKGNDSYMSDVDNYSIKQYAEEALTIYGSKPDERSRLLCTLIVDMLNYGSAAQLYFGYNTSNLVNGNLSDEMKAWASEIDTNYTSCLGENPLEGATAQVSSKSLVLGNSVELKTYLTFGSTVPGDDVSVTYSYTSLSGSLVSVTVNKADFVYESNNRYAAKMSGIVAKDFSQPISIVITKNGVPISGTYTFSYETYAGAMVGNTSGAVSDTLKHLLNYMMAYSRSAKLYFK